LDDDFQFTFATARSYFSAKAILTDLPIRLPVILFNGAFTTNYNTGEHLHTVPIKTETASKLLELSQEMQLGTITSAFKDIDDYQFYDFLPNDGIKWYVNDRKQAKDPRLTRTADLEKILQCTIMSINVIDTLPVISKTAQIIEEQFGDELHAHFYENQYNKGFYWLTMNNKNANKGNAVKGYCEQFGFDLASTTVFGDNLNDLEMMRVGGTAIATSNAHPDVKALADHVIESSNQDAVVNYILKDYAS